MRGFEFNVEINRLSKADCSPWVSLVQSVEEMSISKGWPSTWPSVSSSWLIDFTLWHGFFFFCSWIYCQIEISTLSGYWTCQPLEWSYIISFLGSQVLTGNTHWLSLDSVCLCLYLENIRQILVLRMVLEEQNFEVNFMHWCWCLWNWLYRLGNFGRN